MPLLANVVPTDRAIAMRAVACDRALCQRLRHALREQGGCAGDALGLQGAAGSLGLMMYEDKMWLIEFGPLTSAARRAVIRDLRLTRFIYYCGWTRDGRFIVKHKTEGKRRTRKLTSLGRDAWRLCVSDWPRSTSGSPLHCVDATPLRQAAQ